MCYRCKNKQRRSFLLLLKYCKRDNIVICYFVSCKHKQIPNESKPWQDESRRLSLVEGLHNMQRLFKGPLISAFNWHHRVLSETRNPKPRLAQPERKSKSSSCRRRRCRRTIGDKDDRLNLAAHTSCSDAPPSRHRTY